MVFLDDFKFLKRHQWLSFRPLQIFETAFMVFFGEKEILKRGNTFC